MRGILISTPIQAYMSVLMRGILISTLIPEAYMSVLARGILISTLIPEAYMSVLVSGILISTPIQAYMHERAYERDSHKHANTSIYERAYETPK